MVMLLTLILGLAYPLAITGIAQVVFPGNADGSLIKDGDGNVIGSELIGQMFTVRGVLLGPPLGCRRRLRRDRLKRLEPRADKPEAARPGYRAGGALREAHGLPDDAEVPGRAGHGFRAADSTRTSRRTPPSSRRSASPRRGDWTSRP